MEVTVELMASRHEWERERAWGLTMSTITSEILADNDVPRSAVRFVERSFDEGRDLRAQSNVE